MEKYGYKNISNRNEMEQNAKKFGKHTFSYNSGDYVTNYNFIDWSKQNPCGMPGQTKYYVKTVEELLKANEIVSGKK